MSGFDEKEYQTLILAVLSHVVSLDLSGMWGDVDSQEI